MTSHPRPAVELVAVDAVRLEELIAAAVEDADPDDVTPPLGTGWTAERLGWLRTYHEDRRAGFEGGGDEETAAILLAGRVVGASRLQRTEAGHPREAEWGIWLVKSVRGQGIAGEVLRLAAARAVESGASRLVARTTADNEPAVRVMNRAGATIHPDGPGEVTATLDLATFSPPAWRR